MTVTNARLVPMTGFTLVLRIMVLVLSLIVLALAAYSIAITRGIFRFVTYDYAYKLHTYTSRAMGFVVFTVSRSGVESLLRTSIN